MLWDSWMEDAVEGQGVFVIFPGIKLLCINKPRTWLIKMWVQPETYSAVQPTPWRPYLKPAHKTGSLNAIAEKAQSQTKPLSADRVESFLECQSHIGDIRMYDNSVPPKRAAPYKSGTEHRLLLCSDWNYCRLGVAPEHVPSCSLVIGDVNISD